MNKWFLIGLIICLVSGLFISPVFATDISNCSTLDSAGTIYYLTADITNSTTSHCMDISANNVTLDCQGHTIDGLKSDSTYGIWIARSSSDMTNITIKNCIFIEWGYSLYADAESNNVTITSSSFNNNLNSGLRFDGFNFTVENSIFNNNGGSGLQSLATKPNLIIINLTVQNNAGAGLFFNGNTIVINSTISNNSGGIHMEQSNNIVTGCNIYDNDYGIFFDTASLSSIYNNFFNNTNNTNIWNSYGSDWNTTKQNGTRIYSDGTQIGGNYWTNSTGNGYSDTCNDIDHDGFCDDSYTLATNNTDYLPLSDEYLGGGDTTPPTSNSPSDVSYVQDSSQTIGWILQDETAEGYYYVKRNGTIQNTSTAWTNNTDLQVWINTTTVGNNWNYTIYFNDSAGNDGTPDSVFINITDITAPTSNSPPDASYVQDSSQTIGWILQDETAEGYYYVKRNGTIQNTSTAWTNNTDLQVWINTTTVGNNWNYTIYFNDSAGNDGTPDTVFINITAIVNNPPVITANSTTPSTVYTNTDWLVYLTATDSDAADTITGYTQFYINGTLSGSVQSQIIVNNSNTLISTLSSANFNKSDNLTAEIWVGDGADNITKVNMSVVVNNSIPSISGVDVIPNYPTATQNLTCTVSGWSDTDSDTNDYYFKWYKNNVLNSTNHTTQTTITLDSNLTLNNETWKCEVIPFDGEINGTLKTDSVTIGSTASIETPTGGGSAPLLSLAGDVVETEAGIPAHIALIVAFLLIFVIWFKIGKLLPITWQGAIYAAILLVWWFFFA